MVLVGLAAACIVIGGLRTACSLIGPTFLGTLRAIPLSLLARSLLVDVDPGSRWLSPLISNMADSADDPEPASP